MTPRFNEGTAGGVVFGPAHPGDVEFLVSIDSASPQPWTAEAFVSELKNDPPTLFVLRSAGQVIAFVVTRTHVPETDIVNLAVARDHRGRGLGRFLLGSVLDHVVAGGVQTVFLEVREGNGAARRLYEGAGFKETQRRVVFYRDPVEDAILLRLELGPKDRG